MIIHLVNTQQVADLRKFYRKYAKSDRISAQVLARLPWINPYNYVITRMVKPAAVRQAP